MLITKPYKVLVLDDDESITKLLQFQISQDPQFSPHLFTDPGQALDAVIKERILFGIIDINMPKMYGDEFLDQVNKASMGFRCFIMTGDIKVVHVNNCMSYGGMGFIFKPFEMEEVNKALSQGKMFLDNWNRALAKCHDLKNPGAA